MNKIIKCLFLISVTTMLCVACNSGNPHKRGVAAGKEACECYQLNSLDSVMNCLDRIDNENKEYLNDTAYTNAMEEQMLQCISDGIIDISNPVK